MTGWCFYLKETFAAEFLLQGIVLIHFVNDECVCKKEEFL